MYWELKMLERKIEVEILVSLKANNIKLKDEDKVYEFLNDFESLYKIKFDEDNKVNSMFDVKLDKEDIKVNCWILEKWHIESNN